MPRIRLSTTRVQSAPATNFRLGSGWSTGIRAMKEAAAGKYRADQSVIGAIDSAIVGADRIKNLIDRRAERDADEAVTQWETSMLAGVEGTIGKDGKPQGGIAQTTWQTYEGTDRSPITDLGEIEKTFQSSDAYKGLSGLAREKFNRKVASRRAQYLGTANRIYDRQRIQRTQFMDAQADLVSDRKIETAMLADDATFEAVSREEMHRRMNRKFRPLIENPERIDDPTASPFSMKFKTKEAETAYRAAILGGLRTTSLGRCAKMAENAAVGDPQFVGGKLVTNEEQLAKAEKFAASLKDPYVTNDGVKMPARITPQEYERLQYRFLQARSQLDDRIRKTIAKESGSILAKGDLKTLEAGERQFAATAKTLADGSVGQTAALLAQKEIAKAADERAVLDIMKDMSEGKNLTTTVTGPNGQSVTTSIFDPKAQPRLARCYPKAVEEYRKLQERDKAVNDTELRYAEAALDHMAEDGLHSDEDLARARRLVYEKGHMLEAGRMLTPEDGESFRKRWSDRNRRDESRAAVEFDRAFGVSFEMKPDGSLSKNTSSILKEASEHAPKYPGTGESADLGDYLKMRSAFLERLRALDPASDRVGETKRLISEFKSGWFKDRTTENIEEMTRRMTEINNEAAARVAEERLQAAEEERKRNLPIVSLERQKQGQEPADPLDFYGGIGSRYASEMTDQVNK